jgi:hydrogenase nickel incorporation protein HypB
MCTVCGCGASLVDLSRATEQAEAAAGTTSCAQRHEHLHHDHHHRHAAGHDHRHEHHHHDHSHTHDHGHENPVAQRTNAGEAKRLVRVEQDILAENDRLAERNCAFFLERRILALNLMSGPGSGKTTLLVRTLADLRNSFPMAVIEGDQETSFDAERIRATGIPAVQINTGKGCHLDARMVGDALPVLEPEQGSVVFIENVGNLVCPAAFDLGEAARVVLLSVTEGDDKPLKYSNMFAAAELMLVTKVDLLPFVPFDLERCSAFARRINPEIGVLEVSATSGTGLGSWYDWIARRRADRRAPTAIGTVAG